MSSMDPAATKRKEAKGKSKAALEKLGLTEPLDLSEHEQVLMSEVIAAEDIPSGFSDVGGLDHIVDQLRESVIYPLCVPQLFESAAGIYAAPKGVLLYGPPGCGKTLLAKALAKESGATFINLHVSTLTDKWYGESNKLVAALFSLARKLQPSIIFIDEIDSFMRERDRGDHEVSGMMKAEFMSLWDGLLTGNDTRILVLGATSWCHIPVLMTDKSILTIDMPTDRPGDIDAAFLRRMPKRFAIRLPDASQRHSILSLMLKDIPLDQGFSIDQVVKRTDGLSGSDLKEACRNAAMIPVREYIRDNRLAANVTALDKVKSNGVALRPLRNSDFSTSDAEARANRGVVSVEGLD
ncbi:mitochondrial dynamin GTPase Msp1 [Cystobasidiomycetes sp. EMM_F5]